jgi:hypothetical protein
MGEMVAFYDNLLLGFTQFRDDFGGICYLETVVSEKGLLCNAL